MTPLPGAVQSTGLILATVLAAAGLNLGVMSLGQPDGDGTDVDTAATPTSAALTSNDGGLQALSDTAPAAVDPGAATTVLITDPTATDPAALAGSTLPAGTGVTPGPPVAAGTSSTGAASTAAPAAASTAGATTATTQPTTVTTRPPSTQGPVTLPPATVTTARPVTTPAPTTATTARPTTATTARPTTTTTRAPQTSNYSHEVTGAGSLTVSVTDGRLAFVSATDAGGWTHTVDTNRADLVRVVFKGRGNEIAVSVTLRNGTPNFSEERSNDD